MKDVQTIKRLRSQISDLEAEIAAMKAEVSTKQREIALKTKVIQELKEHITSLEGRGGLKVSEHAIIRYLERVKGIVIEDIEKEILNDSVVELVGKLGGSGTYPGGGFRVVMKNYTVVTVE